MTHDNLGKSDFSDLASSPTRNFPTFRARKPGFFRLSEICIKIPYDIICLCLLPLKKWTEPLRRLI